MKKSIHSRRVLKSLLLLLYLTSVTLVKAQIIKDNQIIIGHADSVKSKILNEVRNIWIYLPKGYNANSMERYPVIYLLDAEWHFEALSGIEHQLSEVMSNTVFPQAIIVGITNTDRNRDLTPTNSLIVLGGRKIEQFKNTGGGERFTSFIEKELFPHIDSTYHTAPYRMLIGHSFGGLTAMNILINHTRLFTDYLVIEPSMWWDGRKLLNEAREAFKEKRFEGKNLFLAIANTMPFGMDTAQVQKDTVTTGNNGHIRAILDLKHILQNNLGSGLNWSFKYYKDDDHGSVPLIAEYDGLHFLLSFYNFPPGFEEKLIDKNIKVDVEADYRKHYDEISKRFGYRVLPPESVLNGLGYFLLQNNLPERAFAAFDLNTKYYPESPAVYVSMGDYYVSQKNNVKAIEYYNKALKIKEDPDTRNKVNKLVH